MLNIFRVSFFGHRDFYEHNKCEKILNKILEEILESKEYVEFFVDSAVRLEHNMP